MQHRDELLDELKQNLEAANNRMKQMADKKQCDVEFEVGDWLFLKLQPYRQKLVITKFSQKLSNQFFGPFQDVKLVGILAYWLILPVGSSIHPVFHASLLKKQVGDDVFVSVDCHHYGKMVFCL